MKNRLMLFIFILLVLFPSSRAMAEERNIYTGDLIELQITTTAFSEDELREKFSCFEIIALKQQPDGYLITLRTFEAGEKTILLGDKEIIITVRSILTDIDRTEVFEGSLAVQKPGFMPDWRIPAGIFVLLFICSGGFLLTRAIQKRRLALLTPLERFLKAADQVSLEDNQALVHLTFCLKMYLEERFSLSIRGKTTSEILRELHPVTSLQASLPEIRLWLEECDYLKFSGQTAPLDKKQKCYAALKALIENLEIPKEGIA